MYISSPKNTRTRRPRGSSRSSVSNRRKITGLPGVRLMLSCTFNHSADRSVIFPDTKAGVLINALIEYCFQPRCVLSPMDADFCVQFVRVMHLQGTPGFWTLTCYDRVSWLPVHFGGDLSSLSLSYQLLGDHVKNIVFSCSEYEARNYGIPIVFLCSYPLLTVTVRPIPAWSFDGFVEVASRRTAVLARQSGQECFQGRIPSWTSAAVDKQVNRCN